MGNVLTELLPRKVRLWLYVLVFLGSAGVAAYTASNGDWVAFSASLLSTIGGLFAVGNTTSTAVVENGHKEEGI